MSLRFLRMQILIVVKTAPASPEYHGYVCRTVSALLLKGVQIPALFFTADGARICTGRHQGASAAGQVRDLYLKLREQTGVQLLCCGGAFREAGFMPGDLEAGFELSGNFELSELFAECDSTVTF